MNDWWLLIVMVLVGWAAIKVVGFVLKLTLWAVLAGAAYYFFSQVFGWPWPLV